MKKAATVGLIALGVIFLALTIYYWTTPADKVPDIISGTLSGYHPGRSGVNIKHGLATLILGIGSGILAWFVSGDKPANAVEPTSPASTEKQ